MHRIHKVLFRTPLSRANFWTKPTEPHARTSESEKKGRRLRATRWSALRPANVIGRTLIASKPTEARDDSAGTKSWRKTEGSISEPIFRPKIRERPPRIFSYYLEAAIHLSPLPLAPSIFIVFRWFWHRFLWLSMCVPNVVAALFYLSSAWLPGIGFSNAITN